MAEWSKNKVESGDLHGGKEFVNGDNLAVEELNAIANNSFYASDKAKRAEELAESAVKGNGSLVTIDGVIQGEWSADFVEGERQKSKNLLKYPYADKTKTTAGITMTTNDDGTITISGQNDGTGNSYLYLEWNKSNPAILRAGTYAGSLFTLENVKMTIYDGSRWYNFDREQTSLTLEQDIEVQELYVEIPRGDTTFFNNLIIKPILVKGTNVGEWQPYNGAILHEKDITKIKLWENPSPNAEFAWSTISVQDMSRFEYLEVLYKPFWSNPNQTIVSLKFKINDAYQRMAIFACYCSESENYNVCRNIILQGWNTILIENGHKDNTVDNARCIPIAIYGIK